LLLRMFRPVTQRSVMAIPLSSLESRLGVLRRRRRVNSLKQALWLVGPVLAGAALLMLVAAFGFAATWR
jgi:hypothetical protein